MNIAIKWIILALAIIMLVPQSFATIMYGFGGSGQGGFADTRGFASIGLGDTFGVSQTLILQPSFTALLTDNAIGLDSGTDPWVNQFHQADSKDHKYHVAAYAYMDTPTSYSYTCNPVGGTSSATITEDLTAVNARELVYGGFAYNPTDYAAVQLTGEADTITYHNEMSSSSTKVSAKQTITSGIGLNITANSWTERGNLINEYLDHTPFDTLNASGFPDWVPGPSTDNAKYTMYAEQNATIKNGAISGSGKSYVSQASLTSNTAVATQTLTATSLDSATLWGQSIKGTKLKTDDTKSSSDYFGAYAYTGISNATAITYTGTTSSSATNQSAVQRLDTPTFPIGTISAVAQAGYAKGNADPDNNTYAQSGYSAEQYSQFTNATTGKNGFKSSAFVSGATATSYQSADIPFASHSSFQGVADIEKWSQINNLTNAEGMVASDPIELGNSTKMTYNAKSTVTNAAKISTSSASAAQTLKATKVDWLDAPYDFADYFLETNYDYVNGTGTESDYGADFNARFINATLGANGYQFATAISGATASAIQSAAISYADTASFWGDSGMEKEIDSPNHITNSELLEANYDALFGNSTTITYSGTSTVTNSAVITSGSATASQTMNANKGEYVSSNAESKYDKQSNWDWMNNTGTETSYDTSQEADITNFTLGKGGIISSATANGASPTVSQTEDITAAQTAWLDGGVDIYKEIDGVNTSVKDDVDAENSAYVQDGKTVSYTSKTTTANALKIGSNTASVTQTLTAKSANQTYREADASWNYNYEDDNTLYNFSNSFGAGCYATAGWTPISSGPVTVSMTGANTDAVSVTGGKTGKATASQSLNVNSNGGLIHRDIWADQSNMTNAVPGTLFHVEASTDIITDKILKTASNSLSGSSASTITSNSSASLSGSWTAKIAKELGTPLIQNFRRSANATNYEGDYSEVQLGKFSKANALAVTFKESANAISSDASAA